MIIPLSVTNLLRTRGALAILHVASIIQSRYRLYEYVLRGIIWYVRIDYLLFVRLDLFHATYFEVCYYCCTYSSSSYNASVTRRLPIMSETQEESRAYDE